jgi:hypothetical protein
VVLAAFAVDPVPVEETFEEIAATMMGVEVE